VPAHRGKTEAFESGIQTAEILKALSQREGVTLFMTLLSVLAVVLGRACQQEDVLIGTDVANRNHLHTEKLIGFFVNQLVLRVNLSGNPTLRELFTRVREATLDAYAHQDVPFERVVEDLAPERTLARAPLFQVKFVLQNTPQEDFQLPDLLAESLEIEDNTSKFDMLINVVDTGQGLVGWNQYDSDLLQVSTTRSLMRFYCACLEFMATTDQIMDKRRDDLIRGAEQLVRRSLEESSGVTFRKRHARQHVAASNA
jgi:non-ribosomal peptide synthetase component F